MTLSASRSSRATTARRPGPPIECGTCSMGAPTPGDVAVLARVNASLGSRASPSSQQRSTGRRRREPAVSPAGRRSGRAGVDGGCHGAGPGTTGSCAPGGGTAPQAWHERGAPRPREQEGLGRWPDGPGGMARGQRQCQRGRQGAKIWPTTSSASAAPPSVARRPMSWPCCDLTSGKADWT